MYVIYNEKEFYKLTKKDTTFRLKGFFLSS